MKPERHLWDEGSTHRSVAGKEYDEVWDYAEQLEAELTEAETKLSNYLKSWGMGPAIFQSRIEQLEAENEALRKAIFTACHEIDDPIRGTKIMIDALLTGEESE